jgi:DNA-binding CsgD family transcriptional regulator
MDTSNRELLVLTGREEQIAALLIEGRSNNQIGLLLDISERTVRFHLGNIFTKLDVTNRVQAVSRLVALRMHEDAGLHE